MATGHDNVNGSSHLMNDEDLQNLSTSYRQGEFNTNFF